MPGFHPTYHAHVLGLSLYSIRKHIGGYEEMAEEVAENWLSATRDDCVRLSRMRPYNASVPLLCQIRAVQDLKKLIIRLDYEFDPTLLRKKERSQL